MNYFIDIHSKQDGEMFHYREPNCSYNKYLFSAKGLPFRIVNKCGKMLNQKIGLGYIERIKADSLLREAMNVKKDNTIRGLFLEWDNTPRHGKRGYVITPPSKEMFMKYMDSIKDSEYVFINAWNEWDEGMMLDPTEQKGYKYLEWIKERSEKNEQK